MEKQPFFRVAMAGLRKYPIGGFGWIGSSSSDRVNPYLAIQDHKSIIFPMGVIVLQGIVAPGVVVPRVVIL